MAHSFFPTRTASLWCGLIGLAGWWPAQATVITFNYTGAAETWTAPAGVETISIKATGARGGGSNGGAGALVTSTLSVTAGETLTVVVGGTGADGGNKTGSGLGGFNGGANGGISPAGRAAGGGGASDVRQGGSGLANRVVVAGGGGGEGMAMLINAPSGAGGGGGGGYFGGGGGGSSATTVSAGGGQKGTASGGGTGGAGSAFSGQAGAAGQGGAGANYVGSDFNKSGKVFLGGRGGNSGANGFLGAGTTPFGVVVVGSGGGGGGGGSSLATAGGKVVDGFNSATAQVSFSYYIASLMASLPDGSVLDFGDVTRGSTAAGQGFQVGNDGEVGSQLRLSGFSGLGNGFSLLSGVDKQLLAVNNTNPFTSFGFGFDATTLDTGLYSAGITLSTNAGALHYTLLANVVDAVTVPEPGMPGLLAVAMAALGWQRRRARG